MKKKKLGRYVLFILLSETVGILSGLLSQEGIRSFSENTIQPKYTPPAIIFPIIWTVLYALMGIGAARISLTQESNARSAGLNLFILQLIVNFFWSPIFFNTNTYGFALLWLLLLYALVITMALAFSKSSKTAAYLQIPYLLWLTFAIFLNYNVWKLNS